MAEPVYEVVWPLGKCKSECERPEELKGEPEECTPEQIKKCHGEAAKHPCVAQE